MEKAQRRYGEELLQRLEEGRGEEDLLFAEIRELLQRLEEGRGEEEPLSVEVEELLQDLQGPGRRKLRRRAAELLGQVSRSSRDVVQALVTAAETDSDVTARIAAAESLGAEVHQAVLEQHPDLGNAMDRARRQACVYALRALGDGRRLALRAKKLGIIGAILCGLVILAFPLSLILAPYEAGADILVLIMRGAILVPVAIGAGLVCLIGAIQSATALRRFPSREARAGLWLSAGPLAVIAFFAILATMFF